MELAKEGTENIFSSINPWIYRSEDTEKISGSINSDRDTK
jgi:hypothetical protein